MFCFFSKTIHYSRPVKAGEATNVRLFQIEKCENKSSNQAEITGCFVLIKVETTLEPKNPFMGLCEQQRVKSEIHKSLCQSMNGHFIFITTFRRRGESIFLSKFFFFAISFFRCLEDLCLIFRAQLVIARGP